MHILCTVMIEWGLVEAQHGWIFNNLLLGDNDTHWIPWIFPNLLSVAFLSIEQSLATAVDKCKLINISIRGCPLHFSLSAPLQLEHQSSVLSTRIRSANSDSHITHRQCECSVSHPWPLTDSHADLTTNIIKALSNTKPAEVQQFTGRFTIRF